MASRSPTRDPITIDAPVATVTLFEDRALVTRRGRVELPAGSSRVRLEDVAPVLSDATVGAEVEADGGPARVLSTRVQRKLLKRPVEQPPFEDGAGSASDLEAERDALDRKLAAASSSISRLEAEVETLDQLGRVTLKEAAEDTAWSRYEADVWTADLDELAGREGFVGERLVEISHNLEQLQRARKGLERRIQALARPSHELWAAIEADVLVERGGPVELRFDYIVPGACWRPYHTARLVQSDSSRIEFSTDACVWQNTGEDWCEVRLRFSTQRPSLGTDPPELTSDVLSVEAKPDKLDVEAREQEITTSGLGVEARVASSVPGIDDGGEAVSMESGETATVVSDGRPYRVPLSRFESAAEVDRVTMPERVAAVLLRSTQTNEAASPILAGPVDLVRNAGPYGRTSVLFVAPGERFAIGWGPEQELRVHREEQTGPDKERTLSSWQIRRHRVSLRLSNIGSQARTVEVVERIPVSEIDKVKVEYDREASADGAQPDADGFVRWKLTLPAFETKTLELAYRFKKHQDVQGL